MGSHPLFPLLNNLLIKMGKLLKVQVVDMETEMRANAEEQILAAFSNFSREDVIANEIKKYFDK